MMKKSLSFQATIHIADSFSKPQRCKLIYVHHQSQDLFLPLQGVPLHFLLDIPQHPSSRIEPETSQDQTSRMPPDDAKIHENANPPDGTGAFLGLHQANLYSRLCFELSDCSGL